MNWLDLLIVLFLIGAFIRGLQTGFVQQFFSTAGFVMGIFMGAFLQGHLISLVHSAQSKSLLALLVISSCAIAFMTLGERLGERLKGTAEKIKLVKKVDRTFGSLMAVVTVLIAVWLWAAMFDSAPLGSLQRQIYSSRIVTSINNALPSAPNIIAKLSHFIDPNGFPKVFTGLEPKLDSDAPLPELGDLRTAVEKTRPSVVKIAGEGCGGIVEGSGFVAGESVVITNAHVVAGVRKPLVIDAKGSHDARVVWFDANVDIAILRTSGLAGAPLALNPNIIPQNTNSVVLGYPGGGGFTASPAVALETFTAVGRNIYNQGDSKRSVLSIKADVRQGNSGGPLVAADGSVIGLLFAESTTNQNIGYALAMDHVITALNQAKDRTQALGTGNCAY